MSVAVTAGPSTTIQRNVARSARCPITPWSRPGICRNTESMPAAVLLIENFSTKRGRSGARKAV